LTLAQFTPAAELVGMNPNKTSCEITSMIPMSFFMARA
jgi:hypothetical protein